jgi:hypothetical protein
MNPLAHAGCRGGGPIRPIPWKLPLRGGSLTEPDALVVPRLMGNSVGSVARDTAGRCRGRLLT